MAFDARVSLVGRHHIQNALAAAAVGLFFAIAPEEIQAALASQQPAKHRMQLFLAGGVTLLDDTYNANPDSMLAALRTLAELPCKGRRIAALGNMGELGPQSEVLHREMGSEARKLKLDALFTVGDLAQAIHKEVGLAIGVHCNDRDELLGQLAATVQPGDVLLLKASRSMQLDKVVEELKLSLGEGHETES
jgi:UDP-N-acetylmuramoyl-tripeptide--D-alanyl-D-alanine ligase